MLDYNPEDGLLRWKQRPNRRIRVGDIAGAPGTGGYLYLRLDGQTLLAHRVAFALTHDRWPVLVDHMNGDKTDNRPANLREASKSMNALNMHAPARSSTGHRGVSYDARRGHFVAKIGRKYLGAFGCAANAAQAYEAAKMLFRLEGRA